MRHLLTRLLLGLLGTGLLLGPVPAWPAAAASPPRPTATTSTPSLAPTATATLVRRVMTAANPAKALAALPRADQARVRAAIRRLAPLHVSTRGGLAPPASSSQAAGRAHRALSTLRPAAARERCWYRYWYYDWGTFGIVMAHTWMTLTWCGDGRRVTRWSRGATGGSSSVAGLTYRGIFGRGALHVGWEVRAYTQFRFSAGLGVTIDTTPCQQIRGGAGGLYSQRDTCDLR